MLYTGFGESGTTTRFRETEVGSDKCFAGSWMSYGLFEKVAAEEEEEDRF